MLPEPDSLNRAETNYRPKLYQLVLARSLKLQQSIHQILVYNRLDIYKSKVPV